LKRVRAFEGCLYAGETVVDLDDFACEGVETGLETVEPVGHVGLQVGEPSLHVGEARVHVRELSSMPVKRPPMEFIWRIDMIIPMIMAKTGTPIASRVGCRSSFLWIADFPG
jgi:hypothetical protein